LAVTIIGSVNDWEAVDNLRIIAMIRNTLNDSIDSLHKNVVMNTPIDEIQHQNATHKPGNLRRSIKKSGPERISTNRWIGEVFSETPYTAAVEYGVGPKILVPKKKKWLRWVDGTGREHFAKEVKWPGFGGAHMFLKARVKFENTEAEQIARINATKWLGAKSTNIQVF